jgi:hypothetical protein
MSAKYFIFGTLHLHLLNLLHCYFFLFLFFNFFMFLASLGVLQVIKRKMAVYGDRVRSRALMLTWNRRSPN